MGGGTGLGRIYDRPETSNIPYMLTLEVHNVHGDHSDTPLSCFARKLGITEIL